MIGVVLEDLRTLTTDLHTYTTRARRTQPEHDEHMKFIDRMVGKFSLRSGNSHKADMFLTTAL